MWFLTFERIQRLQFQIIAGIIAKLLIRILLSSLIVDLLFFDPEYAIEGK
jgi:hypothetical protein